MGILFRTLQKTCEPHLFPGLAPVFHAISELEQKNRYINIAVLGQFKAGKSSFLNHLTGSTLLPVGATPVTNVVTLLQYGPALHITVWFLDGKTRNIPAEDLPDYINEQRNTNNHRQVDRVIIELPELEEFRGTRFIDTPGVGSLFTHNTQATLQFTPDTGLAIVAINPGNPLSEGDITLLEELRTYTPRIYILLTKTDLYEVKDLDEIGRFIRKSLENHFQETYPVFRYSTRADADTHRETILNKIIRPMIARRESLFVEITEYKSRSLAVSCLSYLEAAYQASLKVKQEKQQLKELIRQNRQDMERQQHELQIISQSYMSRTREHLVRIILPYRKAVAGHIMKEFREEYPQWHGNLFNVSRRFEQWIGQHLEKEMKKIPDEIEKDWYGLLKEPSTHFQKYLHTVRQERHQKIERVLNINIHDQPIDIHKPRIKKPDISVYWAFDTNIDLLWFLIPMVLFRKVFGRFFIGRIPDETEKNMYRLISQLTEAINREIEKMKEDALLHLQNELITIENILSSGEDESISLADKIETIKKLL